MNTFNGVTSMSDNDWSKMKRGTALGYGSPEWWDGVSSIANTAIVKADEIIYNSKDLLHEFFNHRSDANKYLTAEQQEDLEKEFSAFVEQYYYKL